MHYSVRLTDFISNLLGGMPQLDQNCLDDLQANPSNPVNAPNATRITMVAME